MSKENEPWHLRQKIIIGIIVGLVGQGITVSGAAWAVVRNMDANIQRNASAIAQIRVQQVEDASINKSYVAHKAMSENQFVNIAAGQNRIEKKLDRLIEREN